MQLKRKLSFHPCGNYRETYEQELNIFETDFGRLWLGIFLGLLFFVAPFVLALICSYILNTIGIAAIAAIGLNILIVTRADFSGTRCILRRGRLLPQPFWPQDWALDLCRHSGGWYYYRHDRHDFRHTSGRLKGLYLTIATLAGQFIIEYF
jgi:branched-chain amino acid transport system permease protein